MGPYEDPFSEDRSARTNDRPLLAGIERMNTQSIDNPAGDEETKQRDSREAEILLNKHARGEDKGTTGYDAREKDKDKYASKATIKPARNVLKDEIYGIVDGKRNQMLRELKDNPQATEMQRQIITTSATDVISNLSNTLADWVVARQYLEEAKEIPQGQEGSIVPNYNPQMIKFLEAVRRNDPNVHLTLDDNNDIRASIVNEEELTNTLGSMGENDRLEFTTFNATEQATHNKEHGPFKTVKAPDYSVIKDVVDQEIKSPDNPGRFGKKEGDNIIYNQEAINEFLSTDPAGMKIMNRMISDEEKYGQWISMGEDIEVKPGVNQWSNTVDTYNDDLFKEGLIAGATKLFPPPKGKPIEETETETITSSTSNLADIL